MERTLQVLDQLRREGVIAEYAIGGAMAAIFYIEPLLTFDLDVFVVLPRIDSRLPTLSPIYEALRMRGYSEDGECVNIEGIPVQFLPAYNPLIEEALKEARDLRYEQAVARVLRVEHLRFLMVRLPRTDSKVATGAGLVDESTPVLPFVLPVTASKRWAADDPLPLVVPVVPFAAAFRAAALPFLVGATFSRTGAGRSFAVARDLP